MKSLSMNLMKGELKAKTKTEKQESSSYFESHEGRIERKLS